MPAQPEAGGVTLLQELDSVIAMTEWVDPKDRYRVRAHNLLRSLRLLVELAQRAGGEPELNKLVEEAECKARIVSAGCAVGYWSDDTKGKPWRCYQSGYKRCPRFATIGEASAWAEAQATQEKWSEPVR